VEAVIVEIKPPDITFDPETGKVDKAIAGYIDGENDEVRIVPVGKVTTEPAISLVKSNMRPDRSASSVRVSGVVGRESVYRCVVAHGRFDGITHERFAEYSEERKQRIKLGLEREATQAVFNVLGIDIQPEPKPRRKGRFTGFLRSWASS
jgi:hypothetical protein